MCPEGFIFTSVSCHLTECTACTEKRTAQIFASNTSFFGNGILCSDFLTCSTEAIQKPYTVQNTANHFHNNAKQRGFSWENPDEAIPSDVDNNVYDTNSSTTNLHVFWVASSLLFSPSHVSDIRVMVWAKEIFVQHYLSINQSINSLTNPMKNSHAFVCHSFTRLENSLDLINNY